MAVTRFRYERDLIEQGKLRIAGADEAGRGPLAGPVVAAVVCFPTAWIQKGLPRKLYGLNDSKQLTEEERERFHGILTSSQEVSYAIASVEVEIIDAINILQASLRAMNEAFHKLLEPPDHTLVDGPYVFSLKSPQTPVIGGDGRSFSIAAASVLAKVTRDRIMMELDGQYPQYGFGRHKGYGTPEHLDALRMHGPCPIHRRSFAPIRRPDPELRLGFDPGEKLGF